jgi:hypothetical protein
MEGMLIWIVMFAGAAIALLAVFLVASEKELKKKRLEIDELLVKLGNTAAQDTASSSLAPMSTGSNEELDYLRARNQDLERELAEVSSKSAPGTDANEELELAQRNVEIARSNAQWLQKANDELNAEIADLKGRLQAGEVRSEISAAEFPGTADRQHLLEAEIASLRQQLAASQSKIRDLDGAQPLLANMGGVEARHREEKHALETKIADLEKSLSAASADKTSEAESLRQRMAESERIQQSLRDEKNGLAQEIARLQPKAAIADEQGRWFQALQEQFSHVLAKQAALGESQRQYQEAVADYSQLLGVSSSGSQPAAGFNEFHAGPSFAKTDRASIAAATADANGKTIAPGQIIAAAAQSEQKPKRFFGIFPAVILFVSTTALVAGLWNMKDTDTTTTVTASSLPSSNQNPAPAPEVVAPKPEPIAAETPVPAVAPAVKETVRPAAKDKVEPVKAVPVARVQQPVTGTYEITQSSRVYAAPSELSQTMGDIEPGVRVNVVGAKNGWLEIHSKHGRPPGFIRKEGARVAAQN